MSPRARRPAPPPRVPPRRLARARRRRPFAGREREGLASEPGGDVAGGAEVLGEGMQPRHTPVLAVLKNELAVRLSDPDGVERGPSEAPVQRVVVTPDRGLGRIELPVHE